MKTNTDEKRVIPDTHDSGDGVEKESAPRTSGALKGLKFIGKWSARTAGVDVLYKDARRIKPRFPKLWKDLFQLRPRNIIDNEPLDRIVLRKTKFSAAFCTLISAALFAYFLAMLMAPVEVSYLDVWSVGVTGLIATASGFVAGCYWMVFGLQKKMIHAQSAQRKHAKADRKDEES